VPPAAGGRAPSFGAPTHDGDWSFRFGGRISGWEGFGIGRKPGDAPDGYTGTALHVPPLTQGRLPFFPGAGASLNMQYGNNLVSTYLLFYGRFNGPEFEGYSNIQGGPAFGQAYILLTPDALGPLRFSVKVGGFIETYAGPGQWGWGVFGPMLALRGFGETSNGDIDLTRDLRLTLTDGVLVVPGVAENFVRGDYNNWIETGTSSHLHHIHAGVTYKNQYTFKLHQVSDWGTDERKYLLTFLNTPPHDGRMDAFIGEARWLADPWGQVGVSGGLWNFDNAASVSDGVWWGLDFSQGSRDMINKFIGPASTGTGKFAFVSAEYDTSIARILWYPGDFDGRAPDLRIAVAGEYYQTLATDDPAYHHASGYYEGIDLEYRFSPLFSFTFQQYGESRSSDIGQWEVFSLNPGFAFHSDWTSTDRIQLIYSRRFYSAAVDNNSAQPLDRDVLVLGGYITF
jgi:hypothetical protein